jgi:hypothetical protein
MSLFGPFTFSTGNIQKKDILPLTLSLFLNYRVSLPLTFPSRLLALPLSETTPYNTTLIHSSICSVP